ncbi:hypothetical protein ACTFIU_005290 [Dictyostelium citrinum]
MNFKIFIFTFIILFFVTATCLTPKPIIKDLIYNETSIVYVLDKSTISYFTRIILFKDTSNPRSEMANNYFNCTVDSKSKDIYCVFHSDEPFSRLWGTSASKLCFKDAKNSTIVLDECLYSINSFEKYPIPLNVKYSIPTYGGDVAISGAYIRFVAPYSPNLLVTSFEKSQLTVKGNFSDKSFNCNNITVSFPQGSGKFFINFDGLKTLAASYAPPVIFNISNTIRNNWLSTTQIITINGDNFFTNNSLVELYFDGERVDTHRINIANNHTQIQVTDINRDVGPMKVNISINGVNIQKSFDHCLNPILTSVTSVSHLTGGVITMSGSWLHKTGVIPTITIGSQPCIYIRSSYSPMELSCKLNPIYSYKEIDNNGKNISIIFNYEGCISISKTVTYSYNIRNLNNGILSLDDVFTLFGSNLGRFESPSIYLFGDDFAQDVKVEQFDISSDNSKIIFKVPPLRCQLFKVKFTCDNTTLTLSSYYSVSFSTKVLNSPSTINGTLNIDLYNINCHSSTSPILTIAPSDNSSSSTSPITCSKPSSPSATRFFQTKCKLPFGTGINKEFSINYVSATNYNKFSYEPPVVLSRTFSNLNENITINGRNFGDTLSNIQVHLNGIDISSTIHLLSDSEFTFKNLESFENGLLNITVDGNNNESPFYLTLPPVIYGIANKDNKVLGCGGFITIFGKKLLANEEEFRVKVIANDQETIVIESDEIKLIVKSNTTKSPNNVSVLVGEQIILSNLQLTNLEPKITVIPMIKNINNVLSSKIGGISLSDYISASLILSSGDLSLSCNLQCSVSPNESVYYNINTDDSDNQIIISTNENDITDNTDYLSCFTNSRVKETSGLLNIQFISNSYNYEVTIEEINDSTSLPYPTLTPISTSSSSSSSSSSSNNKETESSGGSSTKLGSFIIVNYWFLLVALFILN